MMQTGYAINRKIIISEPITDELAGSVIEQIIAINDFDSQMSQIQVGYESQPIEMFINSGGGSATAGNAIIMAMEMSDTPIITYGLGIIASMALAIFISGDIRIATRLSRFMYHSVAYGTDGFIKDHEMQLKEANILQEMYNSLFLEKTKISEKMMERIRNEKKNFFFSAKKALKLGIADDLIQKPEKKFDFISLEEQEMIEKELNE